MPRSRPASSPRSWPTTSLTPSDGTPAGPPEPRLGVELASEVFQAAVNLDGDHAVAGAEPAGDAGGGGEVGAGRGPGEDAFGASGLAGGLECLSFGDGHDLVVVVRMELGRVVADAAALDVMGSRRPAR